MIKPLTYELWANTDSKERGQETKQAYNGRDKEEMLCVFRSCAEDKTVKRIVLYKLEK